MLHTFFKKRCYLKKITYFYNNCTYVKMLQMLHTFIQIDDITNKDSHT